LGLDNSITRMGDFFSHAFIWVGIGVVIVFQDGQAILRPSKPEENKI